MDLKKIDNLFLKYNFKKEKLYIDEDILDFENIYINKDRTEVYIVEEVSLDQIKGSIIEEFQEEILWFENFTENYYLKYNINLIILYDESNSNKEFRRYIEKYERDSGICKKIFIDIKNEDNLCMLPFIDIEIKHDIENPSLDISSEIKKILKDDNLVNILLNSNLDEENNYNDVISLIKCE